MNVAWSTTFMKALAEAGVRLLVVSPGSRSTPLVLGAMEAGLELRTIIDERSAAFFALGAAKVSGMPVALVCTSGSAGAHYLPAMVEAKAAFAPLIAITADRPPELMDCAAPQTIDQTRLFGETTRATFDLGIPELEADALRALRRVAALAVHRSLGPIPGPVHINAPFRKPLEPSDADRALYELAAEVESAPATRAFTPTLRASDEAIELVAAAIRASERGLIVAGPAPLSRASERAQIRELLTATGFPLFAESTSQLRLVGADRMPGSCDAFDLLISSERFVAGHRPDLILQIGAPPTSAAYARFVRGLEGCQRFVLSPHGWRDPQSSATALVHGDVGDIASRLAAAVGAEAERQPWAESLADANSRAWAAAENALSDRFLDSHAVDVVASRISDGALLALSNSLPVRHIDTFVRPRSTDLAVWSQRGASGIDGLVSGAAGAATAHDGPAVLILGDVSAAHDAGGFAVAAAADSPLVIVIIDNGGGRIFDILPLAKLPELGRSYETHWLTPPALSFEALAGAYAIDYSHVASADDLAAAFDRAMARPRCSIIHVRAPSDPEARARVLEHFEK